MKQINPVVIGLGYVGLPLFPRLTKKFKTVGYDLNHNRINQLKKGIDEKKEFKKNKLKIKNVSIFTSKLKKSNSNRFYIITVPTQCYRIKNLI